METEIKTEIYEGEEIDSIYVYGTDDEVEAWDYAMGEFEENYDDEHEIEYIEFENYNERHIFYVTKISC